MNAFRKNSLLLSHLKNFVKIPGVQVFALIHKMLLSEHLWCEFSILCIAVSKVLYTMESQKFWIETGTENFQRKSPTWVPLVSSHHRREFFIRTDYVPHRIRTQSMRVSPPVLLCPVLCLSKEPPEYHKNLSTVCWHSSTALPDPLVSLRTSCGILLPVRLYTAAYYFVLITNSPSFTSSTSVSPWWTSPERIFFAASVST